MKILKRVFILILMLSMYASFVQADLLVIVNASNDTGDLSRRQIIDLYMGRNLELPNGSIAQPIDQGVNSIERSSFYKLLVNKSIAQVNAYWARLLFTGRNVPPKSLADVEEVLQRVRENKYAIAYIDSHSILDDSIRVVGRVP